MIDYVKHLSANRIIGDLIGREKYRFVDGKLIASVVDDVMAIVQSAAESNVDRQTANNNQSAKPASVAVAAAQKAQHAAGHLN